MYSYEERIRAVKLYIELGKRVAATIHLLGYPTENALKSWHREYERCLDLPRGYVRSKPKYSGHKCTWPSNTILPRLIALTPSGPHAHE